MLLGTIFPRPLHMYYRYRRLPQRMLNLKVQGRPRERWINQIKKNLQERGYDWKELKRSTGVEQVVACASVTQRARIRSLVGTSFLGEVFSGFFLTCQTNVRKLSAHKVPEYHLAIIIIHHFITGANDLRY